MTKEKEWKRTDGVGAHVRDYQKKKEEISLSYLVWFPLLTVLRAMLFSGYLDLASSSDFSMYSLYIASLCLRHFQAHLQTTRFIISEEVISFKPRTASHLNF